LIYGGSVTIEATVLDASQAAVSDGTVVSFSLDIASLGSISPFATTSKGKATALFIARDTNPGTVTIVAKVGSSVTSSPIKIEIKKPLTGSIQFLSATPNVIGIKGGGQPSTAVVTFIVKDIQGNPVDNGTSVDFKLNGPNGGEFIGTTSGSGSATAATNGGSVSVILNSGSVAGPVTIVASVTDGGTVFQTSAPTISIGGGVISAGHFVLAADRINFSALNFKQDGTQVLGFIGETSNIIAFVADRFGNHNVLNGTSISFRTEAGSIGTSAQTDANGIATVQFRTQEPGPVRFVGGIEPKNGHVTLLATVLGEEAFRDKNGNGIYDPPTDPSDPSTGETFSDLPEPFLDIDDNLVRTDGSSFTVFEDFIDENGINEDGHGEHNSGNGVWDGPGCQQVGCKQSKMISARHKLVFSGPPEGCALEQTSISVAPGGSQNFILKLGDKNRNAPGPGTSIAISVIGAGKLSGATNTTLADPAITEGGPAIIGFTLTDDDASSTKATAIEVKVTPNTTRFSGCTSVLPGNI
jgi:hypothetical protein